jgi:4-carboxymuconolactone decarboxylase
MSEMPKFYQKMEKDYKEVMEAVDRLGKAVQNAGPLDEKVTQLIKLAAAATQKSEGAVHSHARRAMEAGASPEEISHAVILLVPTIGYPNAAAALSWVQDLL